MRYFDAFRFDEVHGLLWHDNVPVPLTAKACSILAYLIESGETPQPKEAILRTVWSGTHVAPENVKVLIREIRHALGDDVLRPRYIRTLPRLGYAFIAPVHHQPIGAGSANTFVGRRRELALLRPLLTEAEPRRRVIVLEGPAGIGASSLAHQLVDHARQRGGLVAEAQCLPSALPIEPFSPLLDTFDRLIALVPRVADIIAPHAPALLQHLRVPPPLRADGDTARSFATPRLAREIVAAFEALAQDMPLVLCIEDLQWLDAGDVDVLGALTRRRNPATLTIIATTRPLAAFEDKEPLRQLIAELEVTRVATVISLEPWTAPDVERYMRQRFPGVAAYVAEILFKLSGGHPLLVTSTADALVQQRVIRRRAQRWVVAGAERELIAAAKAIATTLIEWQVEQLSQRDRDAVAAAARFGHEFWARDAGRALGLDSVTADQLFERLALRGDVIERVTDEPLGAGGARFRFTNPLFPQVLKAPAVVHDIRRPVLVRPFTARTQASC